jgi:hypothetical protein
MLILAGQVADLRAVDKARGCSVAELSFPRTDDQYYTSHDTPAPSGPSGDIETS